MVWATFHLLRVQVIEQILDVCPAPRVLARYVLPLEPRVLDQICKKLRKAIDNIVQGCRAKGNNCLGVHFLSIAPDMVATVSLSGPPVSEPLGICSVGIQVQTSLSDSPCCPASYSLFATYFVSSHLSHHFRNTRRAVPMRRPRSTSMELNAASVPPQDLGSTLLTGHGSTSPQEG